ncbi:MAG TPA: hypothetical protein VLH19_01050 [Patescibacteria group bacterium]|nr:hypothetical protein [Patescibacteria group bacterium]
MEIQLLMVAVFILTVATTTMLIMLILVLVALHKTLRRLRDAIDTVEDTATRSLAPFLTMRAVFSDFGGFMESLKKAFMHKKRNN